MGSGGDAAEDQLREVSAGNPVEIEEKQSAMNRVRKTIFLSSWKIPDGTLFPVPRYSGDNLEI
jgi:hypothetical protein